MSNRRSLLRLLLFFVIGIGLFPGSIGAFDNTDGIRFGAFSIHPAIFTSIRYVDNIYFLPNDYTPENEFSVPQNLETDFVANVQPSILFDLSVPTFTAQLGYKFYNDQYMGYDDPGNNHSNMSASNHTFSGLLDYQAPFGLLLKVQDSYTNQEVYEDNSDFANFVQGEQVHNDARGLVGFAYGPEDNLYLAYTYVNIIDQFDRYQDFDKMTHMHQGDIKFKFFPRTAFLSHGGYNIVDYTDLQGYDSVAYYGQAGLKGQITRHMILTMLAGYNYYDYRASADGQGPTGDAELAFVWQNSTKLAFGYKRRFKDAVNTNYYTSDEVYLTFNRLWVSRLNTSLFGSYQYNEFSEPISRHEDFIQGNLDVTLRLIFWLYTGVGYQIEHKLYNDDAVDEATTRNTVLLKVIAQF